MKAIPYKQYCILHHSKEEASQTPLGRQEKSWRGRICEKSRQDVNYQIYKPGVKYGLFSSLDINAKSAVLLKKPIKGFLIEKYFHKEKDLTKYKKSLFTYGKVFKQNRIYRPGSR